MQGAGVIIVSSVMFSFISYWRTAAVVLCDLASTSYYIGGIVEQAIGPAAPWLILAVLVLAFAVGLVYIESCSMFVRGGVYRVVREALGSTAAKLAVSALIFDYILTGPISTVSAGHYVVGLILDTVEQLYRAPVPEPARDLIKRWGSVLIACAITYYFYRQNVRGIHESSETALRIMQITAVMGAIMIVWCLITLAIRANNPPGPHNKDAPVINAVPFAPDLHKKVDADGNPRIDEATGHQADPLGFMDRVLPKSWVEGLRDPGSWLGILGAIGILIAFGHSVLAMSGLETLAQVYREVESPKLPNFKKAAYIVFTFALILTGTISFMAVMLIPDKVRMSKYSENLIGGLAMNMAGPDWALLLLNAFVTIVGFLLLAGACNTAIIGANGVLNRVAEDGILPDWLRHPHERYGTTHRVLLMVFALQIITIIASQGKVLLLGEAYAFGVVWSFVFQAVAMVVLRFKDRRPREFKVPLNIPVGKTEIPLGLLLILLVLLACAVLNFLTKEIATIGGLIFSTVFFVMFTITERVNAKKPSASGEPPAPHQHVEIFNQQTMAEVTADSLGLTRHYRKLVSIRSTQNLFMLEKALAETDPETTGMVVMTAKVIPPGDPGGATQPDIDAYEQELMTAVVQRAELAGKEVKPLIIPTNNPLHAVLKTAKDIQAHELVIGASNKYTADEQFEQIAFYWISLHEGTPAPLTVRVLSRERDMYLDLAGGNRIPKISERRARSVDELRAAGVGVDRVLVLHDGSPANSDLFSSVMTMLDEKVALGLASIVSPGSDPLNGHSVVRQDEERARQVDRELHKHELRTGDGAEVVALAKRELYDLIILPLPAESPTDPLGHLDARCQHIVRHAHCRVMLVTAPIIPQEIVDTTPSARP